MERNLNIRITADNIPNWVLVITSGLLTVAAFPPSSLGFLAYFGLVPLLLFFERNNFHHGFKYGYLFGFTINLGILYWLALNKGTEWYWAFISMVAAVMFLGLNYGVIGLLISTIGKRMGKLAGIWMFPMIWTAVEYIRSFGKLGFTWNNLCYTQTKATQLIQFSSILGPQGVTFWIVTINVLIYYILFHKPKGKKLLTYMTVLILFFLIPEVYGLSVLRKGRENLEPKRKVHVGIIQPNVDPNEKWVQESFEENMNLLHNLTDSVASVPLDLVIWPESATPTYLRRNNYGTFDSIMNHISRLDVNLLTGTPDYEWTSENKIKVYNSVFLLEPNLRDFNVYRKIHLVPFGEFIPLSGVMPALKNLNLGQGNFDSGNEVEVFQIPLKVDNSTNGDITLHFTTAICFETTFPQIIRKGTRKGSEMLVVVSNDAWFGLTSAPFLHAEISRFRAIENRIPIVRSANTGISTVIDPYGRILKKIDFGKMGWLQAELQQGGNSTLYVKLGNICGYLTVLVSCVFILLSIFRRKK
jgi:apolipoprotein N-acyltransferase